MRRLIVLLLLCATPLWGSTLTSKASASGGMTVGGSITGSPSANCILHNAASGDTMECGANATVTAAGAAVFAASVTAPFFSSSAADPADAGVFRLANGECVYSEADPAGTDMTICSDSSERWVFTGGAVIAISTAGRIDATQGFYQATENVMNSSGIGIVSGNYYGFAGSNDPTTPDVFLWREAAAGMQMGTDVNGAAVDQTLSAADAITGTDVSGGDLTLESGVGTGAGTISSLIFKTPTVLGTGTTAQTATTRLTLNERGATLVGVMKITPQSAPPATPASGDLYVDSDSTPDELCFYDGTGWQGISSGTDANCS